MFRQKLTANTGIRGTDSGDSILNSIVRYGDPRMMPFYGNIFPNWNLNLVNSYYILSTFPIVQMSVAGTQVQEHNNDTHFLEGINSINKEPPRRNIANTII